jgi:hypothetical protein
MLCDLLVSHWFADGLDARGALIPLHAKGLIGEIPRFDTSRGLGSISLVWRIFRCTKGADTTLCESLDRGDTECDILPHLIYTECLSHRHELMPLRVEAPMGLCERENVFAVVEKVALLNILYLQGRREGYPALRGRESWGLEVVR